MKTTLQLISECQDKLVILLGMIPLAQLQARVVEIDALVNLPNFWGDPRSAAALMKERQKAAELLEKLRLFTETATFNSEFAFSFPNDTESLRDSAADLLHSILEFEFKQMMSDPVDDTAAILTINAGAGGLESANFVSMLLRMYSRYASDRGFNIEILDMKNSDEHSSICIDAVSIRLEGKYAYGYLKGENGVHRLIRNSPFNSGSARHTSFAAVSVSADIEDTIDIKIEEKDIDVVATTAGGPGGQNSNKVCSAIRLRHFPTGINIFVRTERDQLANKKTAFKMLKAKLYDIEMKKKQEEKDKHVDSMSDVSFGHQVRTYTESPYSLVKDHRTDYEINNFEKVLDGDIHEFILASLRHSVSGK